MSRPRNPENRKLPKGVYPRGKRYVIVYVDASGRRREEAAGRTVRGAEALLRQRKQEASEGIASAPGVGRMPTLDVWADDFFKRAKNRTRGEDVRTYAKHIKPQLGHKRLDEIRRADCIGFVDHLIANANVGAARIINIHSVLSRMLVDAVDRELLDKNVAHRLKNLPKKSKRKEKPQREDDTRVMVTSPNLDPDYQILLTMQYYLFCRIGEAAGRRWRDYDTTTPGLHAMRIHTQYQDEPLKTSEDEDTKDRIVPVHPALAAALAAWRLRGFASVYGRVPTDDDFIVPSRRSTRRARTWNSIGKGWQRRRAALGLEDLGTHSIRRAGISAMRSKGAAKDIVEAMSHNSSGEILDVYTTWEWGARCDVVKLLPTFQPMAEVVELRPAANGDRVLATVLVTAENDPKTSVKMVEAAGIELSSTVHTGGDSSRLPRHGGGPRRAETTAENVGADADLVHAKRVEVLAMLRGLHRTAVDRGDEDGAAKLAQAIRDLGGAL